ncbi:DUF3800 domain-containing protein [Riemerella anatipestifer]|uniref:DUF3800 domain-containing protein n=1 Tax=Riemerella anatipestifer TaxID=34085 RepID=UPI0030C1E39F
MNIYFDESGNSGENLLDKDQPVFVLVSHNLTKQQSIKLLENFETDADEIHFKKLRKYSKHYKHLEKLLNDNLIDYSHIKIAFYYKKFAICAHLVDQIVETFYLKKGLSFYERGLNILYANTLYIYCEFFEFQQEFNQLLFLFQKMFREKTAESIEEFYKQADHIENELQKKDQGLDFFYPISHSREYIEEILRSDKKYRLELTIPSITILSDIWFKETGKKIDIIHDESKSLKEWEDTIMELSNPQNPTKQIGIDVRTMTFPLPIKSITRVDSRKYPQVQLADLLGSSFAYYAKQILLNQDKNDALALLISKTKLAMLPIHSLNPDMDFDPKNYEKK